MDFFLFLSESVTTFLFVLFVILKKRMYFSPEIFKIITKKSQSAFNVCVFFLNNLLHSFHWQILDFSIWIVSPNKCYDFIFSSNLKTKNLPRMEIYTTVKRWKLKMIMYLSDYEGKSWLQLRTSKKTHLTKQGAAFPAEFIDLTRLHDETTFPFSLCVFLLSLSALCCSTTSSV